MQITEFLECHNKTVTRQSSCGQRKSLRLSGKLHCLNFVFPAENVTLGPVCLRCEASSLSVSLSMLKVTNLLLLFGGCVSSSIRLVLRFSHATMALWSDKQDGCLTSKFPTLRNVHWSHIRESITLVPFFPWKVGLPRVSPLTLPLTVLRSKVLECRSGSSGSSSSSSNSLFSLSPLFFFSFRLLFFSHCSFLLFV